MTIIIAGERVSTAFESVSWVDNPREVRHPIHGECIEASLTVTAESINRSGTGYLGVCRGVLDAGAVGDAGASE